MKKETNEIKPNRLRLLIKLSVVWSISSFLVCCVLFLSVASALAVSTKLKWDGDALYKSQHYEEALQKYAQSKNWWILEKINPNLRKGELEVKLAKVNVMVWSAENFKKGMEAFVGNDLIAARQYLNQVVLNDPNYEETQGKLSEIKSRLAIPPTPVAKPQSLVKTVPAITPVVNNAINYKFDSEYPILLRMEGLGGVFYNSYGNGVSGPYSLDRVYHPGDKLHIKAYAQDPKGRQIHYRIQLVKNTTVNSNEADIELTQKDISDSVGITVSITVDALFHRFSDMDDYMQFLFKVRP